MLMSEKISDSVCLAFQSFLTLTQTDEIFRIISLVLTIISALVVLAKNIYDWYIKAKKDGKIDAGETKDLIDIVDKGVNDIKENLENNKK